MDLEASQLSEDLIQCLRYLRDHPSEAQGNFPLNVAVLKAIPKSATVVSANAHGECNMWFTTGCIEAVASDGQKIKYFVKYGAGELARAQLEGEFESMLKLFAIMPSNVPKPYAWGALQIEGSIEGYFYLSEFVEFHQSRLPDPVSTGLYVARLHQFGRSPTGQFGFDFSTYDGIFRQVAGGWEPSWPTFFKKLLCTAAQFDRMTNGTWQELDLVMQSVQQHVIPRLLGALEADGRKIEPSFIHGDLWEGNIGTEVGTEKIFFFDAGGYYAHHEMELGIWRTDHHLMHPIEYRTEYFKHLKPSEPVAEVEDRIRLYSIKAYLMYSAHCRGHYTRQRAWEEMLYLRSKYAPIDCQLIGPSLPIKDASSALTEEKHVKAVSRIIDVLTEEERLNGYLVG